MAVHEVDIIKDIPYVDQGNPRQICDIYLPKSSENHGFNNSAVIIYVHGGGWIRGEKDAAAVPCSMLASKGFPAVACSYTLADESRGKNYTVCLKDVASVVAWIVTPQAASHLKFCPKNILLAGHSAGGHLVMMLVLQSKWIEEADKKYNNNVSTLKLIRGVIGIGGVYDVNLAYESNQDLSEVLYQSFGKDQTKWPKHCPATCDLELNTNSPGSACSPSDFYQALPLILLIHSYEDEVIDGNQVPKFLERFESDEDTSSDGYGSKVEVSKGHYGFHHEMFKREPLIEVIVNFAKNQLSL